VLFNQFGRYRAPGDGIETHWLASRYDGWQQVNALRCREDEDRAVGWLFEHFEQRISG